MDRKEFIKSAALGVGSLSIISAASAFGDDSNDNSKENNDKSNIKSSINPIALPLKVAELFASRNHRLHHALWHGLRDYWNNESLVSELAKVEITKLYWNPPRPSLKWNRDGWIPLTTNGSGIDFLFMHREMILEFDEAMKKEGADPDIGWKLIPEPGRPESTHPGISVPPTWELPESLKWLERRFKAVKSDEFYWSRMRWWDRDFHDHRYLRNLTLGELGSLIETSVHNDMHMRWAGTPIDPETGKPTVMGRPENSMDKKWDNVKYDFIGETYSSQVNPIFWRLHKWVDSIIDEWFIAHNSFEQGRVKRKTIDGIPWFESTDWVENDSPWSAPSKHAHHDIPTMEKVFELLFPADEQKFLESTDEKVRIPMTWF